MVLYLGYRFQCQVFIGITLSVIPKLLAGFTRCGGKNVHGPPTNVFFLTSAYFVNGNTQLLPDLTDNQFYPSEERICLCIRLNNAGKWACDRLTEDDDFGKKKSSLQMKLILISAGI